MDVMEAHDITKKPQQSRALLIGFAAVIVALAVVVIALAVTVAHAKSRRIDDATGTRESDLATIKQLQQQSTPPRRKSDSPLGNYTQFAIAADMGTCSSIGRDILIAGGNVVDAAIAVDLCIGITDPHSSGIGGGFFMTLYNATTQTCTIIDAREMAPGKSTDNMYAKDPTTSQRGYLAIGIPGEIHGLYTAYKMFGGSLPWKKLLEPSIQLCKDGIPVTGALAKAIEVEKKYILSEPTLRSIFVSNQTGLALVAGEIMRRPQLALTLQKLADSKDPIVEFYQGSIAKTIVKDITDGGGIMTLEDMKRYSTRVRDPLVLSLSNGLKICGPPPPAGAAIAMGILNILDGFDMTAKNLESFDDSVTTFHRIIEAQKFAYAMRSDLGDTDFVDDALKIAKQVISGSWAQEIRDKITDSAHPTDYYGGHYQKPRDMGTSHMSLLDRFGNAISLTSTVNLYFGSKRRSPELGIIYNDQMDDFSTPNVTNAFGFRASEANFIRPYKRPQSSISPLVIFNGTSGVVRLVVGASGGSTIISGTAYVAVHNLFLGSNIKQAVDYPRLHNQLYPELTKVEEAFPPAILKALEQRGQTFKMDETVGSMSSAIERRGNDILANSEYRKAGGFPAGL